MLDLICKYNKIHYNGKCGNICKVQQKKKALGEKTYE